MRSGLDGDHPLIRLADQVDWPSQDRLFWGIHLFKILRGLHDQDLAEAWVENPYFQVLCGEESFRHDVPFTLDQVIAWRHQVGPVRLEQWLSLSLPAAPTPKTSTFVIDVDGVVAMLVPGNDYRQSHPIPEVIAAINRLYDQGHTIIMLTARGSATGLSWEEVTRDQFARWGLKYHELRFGKPAADYYVDDRMVTIDMLCAMAAGRPFPPSSRAPRLADTAGANENH